MQLVNTRSSLAELLAPSRSEGRTIALVPTMGALHDGHASLIRLARERIGAEGLLAVSIFVNPLQFGPNEDFDRYPRPFDDDLALCEREGVDLVFAPARDEMYPNGDPIVTVDPGLLGTVLEGAARPTHFRGVLTVVNKLFALIKPTIAVFGEKDYQQLALIRRMVSDLNIEVDVVGAPTQREADGLARSSRNRYLSEDEHALAVHLSESLRSAQAAAVAGGAEAARKAGLAVLGQYPQIRVDYLEVFEGRILVAARIGSTRLIDNLSLTL